MSRYIDADKVLKELHLNHKDVIYIDKNDTAKRIEKIQGIDIVRCKECLLFNRTYHYCRHFNKMSVNTDDYCSYGERAKQTEPQTDCSWK